ncbi:hypothetical protein Tco_1538339 [Tanacetum coccineum]
MHTTMVPEQVKTMKIQAGIQVSRPGELKRQLQLWKRFGRLYSIVFVLVRNISRRPYALSWKPCQGDSLNLPDHRIHKDGDGDASFQLKSDSLPHAHAQTTKTFYKHQDLRIMKAQELKDKYFRTNSDIQDLPSKISSLSREIVSKLSR